MTHTWPGGVAIHVVEDERKRPVQFYWQGQLHGITGIDEQWQVDGDWWHEEGRIWRDYFAVTTEDGLLCVLYYDHLAEEWRLSKLYD
jgi:hypothetical protein